MFYTILTKNGRISLAKMNEIIIENMHIQTKIKSI